MESFGPVGLHFKPVHDFLSISMPSTAPSLSWALALQFQPSAGILFCQPSAAPHHWSSYFLSASFSLHSSLLPWPSAVLCLNPSCTSLLALTSSDRMALEGGHQAQHSCWCSRQCVTQSSRLAFSLVRDPFRPSQFLTLLGAYACYASQCYALLLMCRPELLSFLSFFGALL